VFYFSEAPCLCVLSAFLRITGAKAPLAVDPPLAFHGLTPGKAMKGAAKVLRPETHRGIKHSRQLQVRSAHARASPECLIHNYADCFNPTAQDLRSPTQKRAVEVDHGMPLKEGHGCCSGKGRAAIQ